MSQVVEEEKLPSPARQKSKRASLETKVTAIRRIYIGGERRAAVARSLGIAESTLRGWFKKEGSVEEILRQARVRTEESPFDYPPAKKLRLDEGQQTPLDLSRRQEGASCPQEPTSNPLRQLWYRRSGHAGWNSYLRSVVACAEQQQLLAEPRLAANPNDVTRSPGHLLENAYQGDDEDSSPERADQNSHDSGVMGPVHSLTMHQVVPDAVLDLSPNPEVPRNECSSPESGYASPGLEEVRSVPDSISTQGMLHEKLLLLWMTPFYEHLISLEMHDRMEASMAPSFVAENNAIIRLVQEKITGYGEMLVKWLETVPGNTFVSNYVRRIRADLELLRESMNRRNCVSAEQHPNSTTS